MTRPALRGRGPPCRPTPASHPFLADRPYRSSRRGRRHRHLPARGRRHRRSQSGRLARPRPPRLPRGHPLRRSTRCFRPGRSSCRPNRQIRLPASAPAALAAPLRPAEAARCTGASRPTSGPRRSPTSPGPRSSARFRVASGAGPAVLGDEDSPELAGGPEQATGESENKGNTPTQGAQEGHACGCRILRDFALETASRTRESLVIGVKSGLFSTRRSRNAGARARGERLALRRRGAP